MTKKLTLSMEESVIEQVKKIAAKRGISVSKLVSDYIRVLAASASPDRPGGRVVGPLIRRAMGPSQPSPDEISQCQKAGVNRERIEIGPVTRQLTGIVQAPPDKDYKELIAEAIEEKHGIKR